MQVSEFLRAGAYSSWEYFLMRRTSIIYKNATIVSRISIKVFKSPEQSRLKYHCIMFQYEYPLEVGKVGSLGTRGSSGGLVGGLESSGGFSAAFEP